MGAFIHALWLWGDEVTPMLLAILDEYRAP